MAEHDEPLAADDRRAPDEPLTPLPAARYLLGLGAGFVLAALAALAWSGPRGMLAIDPVRTPKRAEQLIAYTSRETTEDLLVIGSSRVGGGLDAPPMQTWLERELDAPVEVYKLGVPGLLPDLVADLLEGPIAARPPRQLLVIAVEARFFCRPRRVGGPERENAGQGDGAIAGEWLAADDASRGLAVLGGLRGLWTAAWVEWSGAREEAAPIAARSGEVRPLDEKAKRLRARGNMRGGKRDLFVLPEGHEWVWPDPGAPSLEAWERCLAALEELPCDVLLVRMPLMEGFDEQQMPGVWERFQAEILGPAAERGIDFVDLQGDPFPSGPLDFYSLTHLNVEGARRTSRLLATEVLAPRLRGR